ncbi:Hypothetical protein R9X50_00322100 [Acrodontium crateriforme]|uniref:DUF7371 domain-containing protein n=1 Tax=Acrodontium crateriforme TaxID=150365 RepID=A0AAQ3M2G0_9PEZI|nr:Hypothetical protein R9X50_00322100 [Acrodontium crateriforme]
MPFTSTSTTTIYAPFTSSNSPSGVNSPITTVTSESTVYSTVTVTQEMAGSTAVGPYYYGVVSGTTSWLNSIAPNSDAVLATETTSIFVSPVASTTVVEHLTIKSTVTDYETITLPPYTSTVYSYAGPGLTLTSTSTLYSAIVLSSVLPSIDPQSSPTFRGVGPAGWNATSIAPASSSQSSESETAASATSIYYSRTGLPLTSTSTIYMTSTSHVTDTTTLTMTSSSSGDSFGSSAAAVMTSSSTNITTSVQSIPPIGSDLTDGISTTSLTSASIPLATSASSGLYPNSSTAGAATVFGPGSGLSDHASGYGYTPSSLHTSMSMILTYKSFTIAVASTIQNGSSLFSTVHSTLPRLSSVSSPAASVLPSSQANSTGSGALIALSSSHYPSLTALPSPHLLTTYTVVGSQGLSSVFATNSSMDHSSVASSMSNQPLPSVSSNATNGITSSFAESLSIGGHGPYSYATTSVASSSLSFSHSSTAPNATAISSSSNTASSTSMTASTIPTACGQHGNFTMTFDDLPNFVPTNANTTDITQAPPLDVHGPYYHLTFGDGYVYTHTSAEPYAPHSSPNVAVFLGGTHVRAGGLEPGEIADGIYQRTSAFWFDAHNAWIGCDNVGKTAGQEPCVVVMNGYTWSDADHDEVETYSQNVTVPPCGKSSNCPLQQVEFPTSFRNLTGLQMQAFVRNDERMFIIDDISLSWSNDTCAAGLLRLKYQ